MELARFPLRRRSHENEAHFVWNLKYCFSVAARDPRGGRVCSPGIYMNKLNVFTAPLHLDSSERARSGEGS